MVRTQVYLTEKEREGLSELAAASGKKQAELIEEAAGMWHDRKDLPDFAAARRSRARG